MEWLDPAAGPGSVGGAPWETVDGWKQEAFGHDWEDSLKAKALKLCQIGMMRYQDSN